MRLAAVADLHYTKQSAGALQPWLAGLGERADVLLLGGDLTDYGLPEEGRLLARELTAAVSVPMLAVLGNHDFEGGRSAEVAAVFEEAGIRVLDGDSVEIGGVGFAGVKGFLGGFGSRVLEPWGEDGIKRFVHEAVEESLKLERALARLRTSQRVAIMHYAPVAATVAGEPLEIFPFLGCSRLEEPINRYRVTAVFHGHAHRGSPEGRTASGIPVYNVALPLLRRTLSPEFPVRILEIPVERPADDRIGPAERRLHPRGERGDPSPPESVGTERDPQAQSQKLKA